MDHLERELSINQILYLPLVDEFNLAMAIFEVKITQLYSFNKLMIKGVPKMIWGYGDCKSIKNKFNISDSEDVLLNKNKLKDTVQDCILFLEEEKKMLAGRIKIRKSDLSEEIVHLEALIKETKKEIKDLNNTMNRNLNKLNNLDIKKDLMNRGVLDYEE